MPTHRTRPDLLERLLVVEQRQLSELREIAHELHPHRHIGIYFNGGFTMPNAVTLNVGQSTTATIVPLQSDGTTQTPGAVVSKQTFTLADPSLTISTNADGTATIVGVAASTGAVTGSATATVTEEDGAVSTFTQSFTVTVVAVVVVPPTALTTEIGITFSTPVDEPTPVATPAKASK